MRSQIQSQSAHPALVFAALIAILMFAALSGCGSQSEPNEAVSRQTLLTAIKKSNLKVEYGSASVSDPNISSVVGGIATAPHGLPIKFQFVVYKSTDAPHVKQVTALALPGRHATEDDYVFRGQFRNIAYFTEKQAITSSTEGVALKKTQLPLDDVIFKTFPNDPSLWPLSVNSSSRVTNGS